MFLVKLAIAYLVGMITASLFWFSVSKDTDVYSEEGVDDVNI